MFRLGLGILFTSGILTAGDLPLHSGVREAIPRSLRYMETRAEVWKNSMGCASCHHVPMMLWSCYTAESKGYAIDNATVDRMRQYILQDGNAAHLLPPENPPPDRDGTQLGSVYAVLGLEAGPPGWVDSELGKAFRTHYLGLQLPDGSWPPFPSAGRSPIMEGGAVSSRMVALALAAFPREGEGIPAAEAADKAAAWSAQPLEQPSHQIRALQLMVALKHGAVPSEWAVQLEQLLALQREDGSWAQTTGMDGDAYATGQSLFVLGMAGRRLDDPAVASAAAFLLRTQSADGFWPMASRKSTPDDSGARNLEPITFAATAWAVLGLLAVS